MVSGRYWKISYCMLTYTVLVYNVSYLSNQWNHLFITIQKIMHIPISFKINMYVYVVFVFMLPLLLYTSSMILF